MNNLIIDGPIYQKFCDSLEYSADTIQCIKNTVVKLVGTSTSADKPGMLLGKIQSGKTKTFFGVIALSFDNRYDVAVILTKGTVALAQQTYERLRKDFGRFIENDEIQVFDIMHLPELTQYELKQKLIIVCKKEDDNLKRLSTFFGGYHDLIKLRVLIIDDEADFASVGFRRTKEDSIKINVISRQIDDLRKTLPESSFLQVTATPYSLYLQPSNPKLEDEVFKPIRPAFTELVPIHTKYIGGEYYFEKSEEEDSIASFLYEPVTVKELQVLQKEDRRVFKKEESLTCNAVQSLRDALMNFIVGGCIRRLQSRHVGDREKKYSFIVHTERSRDAHTWQEEIVTEIVEQMKNARTSKSTILQDLTGKAYNNLARSIAKLNLFLPDFEVVKEEVNNLLPSVMITKVNSENDIKVLLDESGQLKLRTPLNIFIGGQILDRGLTILNLIGFFYGRNPKKFQQDTVLQHSRMYGARPEDDLAVTRFYTTESIYEVMKCIHELDSALRDEFEKGGDDARVRFIHKDAQSRIIACSPNKILISSTTTLRPYKRLFPPVGFQTDYKTTIYKTIQEIDSFLKNHQNTQDPNAPFLIAFEKAKTIIDKIHSTFVFDDGPEWNVDAFKASMEYVCQKTKNEDQKDKIWCLVRRNRNLARIRPGGRIQDAPDTSHLEGKIAQDVAIDVPMLMLFGLNGEKERGWRDCPFWWPVLYMPKNMPTVIFASDIEKSEETTF